MNRIATLSLLLLSASVLPAQLPETDVWLFSYNLRMGSYVFTGGLNVSNHPGYDNQPSFSENGSYMLWTSQRDSDQTDIFRYDVANHNTTRITQTAYSEYSPTYMPGNKFISAVVVEKDSVQRLWKYNKISGESKLLLPKTFGVGYSCWWDAYTVFLFQVTDPSTLVIADVRSGLTKTCVSNVGRCMQVYRSPKKKMLLYTQPDSSGTHWISALDGAGVKDPEFKSIKGLAGSQDFVVDRSGNILMAKGAKLYAWNIAAGTEWAEIADFSGQGLHNITRITISPDGNHIAFVDTSADPKK